MKRTKVKLISEKDPIQNSPTNSWIYKYVFWKYNRKQIVGVKENVDFKKICNPIVLLYLRATDARVIWLLIKNLICLQNNAWPD